MVLASLLAFLHLTISYAVFCCGRLSPLFNMIVGVPILLIWTVGFGLLVYNMYGTLSHSCSKTNWATEDGMAVCSQYKAFFSFVVIGWLCQIALIVVDVRAKRTQSATGKYDKMDRESDKDVKLATLENHSRNASTNDIPYGIDEYRDRSNSANSIQRPRYDPSPYGSERSVHRVDDFFYEQPQQPASYVPQQTTYSPQTHYYQPTYDGMRLR
jgi:hypothetical protein